MLSITSCQYQSSKTFPNFQNF